MGKEVNDVFVRKGDVFDVVFLTMDMQIKTRRCRYIGRDLRDNPMLKDIDPFATIPSGAIVTLGAKRVGR